jgi:hypothetical protein
VVAAADHDVDREPPRAHARLQRPRQGIVEATAAGAVDPLEPGAQVDQRVGRPAEHVAGLGVQAHLAASRVEVPQPGARGLGGEAEARLRRHQLQLGLGGPRARLPHLGAQIGHRRVAPRALDVQVDEGGHPRAQHLAVEGLRHHVHHAGVERRAQLLARQLAGAVQQHRRGPGAPAHAQEIHRLHAVHVGQHRVQQHHRRIAVGRDAHRLLPGRRAQQRAAQRGQHRLEDERVLLARRDQEDRCGAGGPGLAQR